MIGSNYPNPFNPSTTIAFSIPRDSLVKLSVFNLRGQKIIDLLDEDMLRGHHKIVWDGKDKNKRRLSSGIYLLKLEAAGNISTQKVMLMK